MSPTGAEVLGRAEEDDDDRRVADDPAQAEHRPGRDLWPCGWQQYSTCRRGLRLADRVGSLPHVLGIACRPSRVLATTSGSATSESIVEAAKKERPKTTPSEVRLRNPSTVLEKIRVPNSARTIEGMPAIASIVDSTTRARADGPAVLGQPDGDADADRHRYRGAHRGDDQGPEQGVREAARFAPR